MGSGSSKSIRHSSPSGSSSLGNRYPEDTGNRYPEATTYPAAQGDPSSQSYLPQSDDHPPATQNYNYASSSQNFPPPRTTSHDNYNSLEQVRRALSHAGLESSNLIVGIDFTTSNLWTGATSFNCKSLHRIGDCPNPYEEAISIIGRTLSVFDEDNLIPCFGFGDASTSDQDVFSFYHDNKMCNGFEEALSRYREIAPHVKLGGPRSFAPIIEMATTIVEESGGRYHVLLIIADGKVPRSTKQGTLSPEENTVTAIVRASEYPLSIILVGVGDDAWSMIKQFDGIIPVRAFDNFQLVNFTEIMSRNKPVSMKVEEFARAALKEIPSQYKATIEHNLLGCQRGKSPKRSPLSPRLGNYSMPSFSRPSRRKNIRHSSSPHQSYPAGTGQPATAAYDNQVCPICLTKQKDMAFGCGHQTCCDCGRSLTSCPICRGHIKIRIKLDTSAAYENQVTEYLARAGLESSNLIVGIDFTKSNDWTGARSSIHKSLHHIGDYQNPYEKAISIIGRTLSVFDEDNLIPCFGFGDVSTGDQDVFSFYRDNKMCNGFEEVLSRYREIVPLVQLAGPRSFAPIIEMATTIVEESGGRYHVLLIIADGEVPRSVYTEQGTLSPEEEKTVIAIVRASEYPLSIILVGVGDEAWLMIKQFDGITQVRAFDNFQYVNFTEIMSRNEPASMKEEEFARVALKEIPSQYKATREHNVLGRQRGKYPKRSPLPPPLANYSMPSFSRPSRRKNIQHSSSPHQRYTPAGTGLPATAAYDNQLCPICHTNPKDMAFGCGHQTCCDCGGRLTLCPKCSMLICIRIKLY